MYMYIPHSPFERLPNSEVSRLASMCRLLILQKRNCETVLLIIIFKKKEKQKQILKCMED